MSTFERTDSQKRATPVIVQEGELLKHWCPGCQHDHFVHAKKWSFNQDFEKPTLSPSVRHQMTWTNRDEGLADRLCQYFLRDGVIEFCSDCTHELAGQRVHLESKP
jgi:hypothetical protein